MTVLHKMTQVNDNLSINRYENGWMVEINGRNAEDDYRSVKIICMTQDELFELLDEYNGLPVLS